MPTTPDNTPRPRPIVVTQAVMAALGAVVGSAGFADQIPEAAAWWILTGYAAINVGLALYLQSITTPLSAPRDAQGRDLVPADTTTITMTEASEVPGDAVGGLAWTQRDPNTPVQPRPDL